MRGHPSKLFFVFIVLASLVLSSCSGISRSGGDVPRKDTLIITPWGPQPEIKNPNNFNVYPASGYNHQREIGDKTIYEALMYTNLNTGELVPWQAESYKYNDTFTVITVKLRKGITWSDGKPFTSADVKYTLEMLRDGFPDLLYSSIYKEWLKSVDTPRRPDRDYQSHQARAALLRAKPRAGAREPSGNPARPYLAGPGSQDVHQLRSREGLAGWHRCLQTGQLHRPAAGV